MDAACVMWGLIWLIILYFVGWPISIFLGGLYGFFSPLTTLIGLDDVSEILLKGVNVGRQCAKNVQSAYKNKPDLQKAIQCNIQLIRCNSRVDKSLFPASRKGCFTSRTRCKMDAACVMWGVIWLIILFFVGWPISIFLGGLYGFFSPLTTLIGLDDVSEILLKGVNVGRQCAKNVQSGKPLC